MAFSSTTPEGQSDPSKDIDGHGIRTEHSVIAQAVWLWLGGVVVITVLAIAFALHSSSKPAAEGTVTVGDAVAGGESAPEAGESEDAEGDESSEYTGYRLVELASALGFPHGAVPDGAIEMGMSQDQAQMYLMDLVNEAVTKGVLTPAEADGVLKAYEAGIVTAPVNITGDDEDNADSDAAESEASHDHHSSSGSSN